MLRGFYPFYPQQVARGAAPDHVELGGGEPAVKLSLRDLMVLEMHSWDSFKIQSRGSTAKPKTKEQSCGLSLPPTSLPLKKGMCLKECQQPCLYDLGLSIA